MATYLDLSLAKLEEFEGSIPWMYRDTVGRVTVGVGLMLADSAAAQKLPFYLADTPATAAQIAAEYTRVDSLPMGRPALFYHRPAALTLPKTSIDSLLRTVLVNFEAELRTHIPTYDSLPDSVKLALLDMAYNLGPAGLLHGYPRLIEAVASGNFAAAAAASFRHGPGATRNQWTHRQFLASVASAIKAQSESAFKRFGFGLLGLSADIIQRIGKPR